MVQVERLEVVFLLPFFSATSGALRNIEDTVALLKHELHSYKCLLGLP